MKAITSTRSSIPISILLFMGTSFIAFLLSSALHETGHYLSSTILGVPTRGIVLHPFGQDYNIYLGDLAEGVTFSRKGSLTVEEGITILVVVFTICVLMALLFYLGRRTRSQHEKDATTQCHPEITPQSEMTGFDNQER